MFHFILISFKFIEWSVFESQMEIQCNMVILKKVRFIGYSVIL